ncbi:Gfo/Idh/MocA family oxidoreductase [Humibacter antri]
MAAKLTFALVGAGSMGRNHARVINESPDASLVAIADPFRETAEPVARSYGAKWVAGVDDLPDVDAVVVAASTEFHYDIAAQILRNGKPLLIEKPVCPSLDQTAEILDLAERADVPIVCGLLERFNPAVVLARKMIEDPVYVRAERHSPYAPRIKTGVAWDLLVHDLDLVIQLFGEGDPESTQVQLARVHPLSLPGAEDVVEANLKFSSGVASVSASRIAQKKVRSLTVQTLNTMYEIDLLRRTLTLFRHAIVEERESGGAGFRQSTEMEIPEVTGGEPLAMQFAYFQKLIRGGGDMVAERESIIPAHRIVAQALAGRV